MTVTAHCPTCNRTVYLAEEDTAACPVCSSPLLAAVEEGESATPPDTVEPAAGKPAGAE